MVNEVFASEETVALAKQKACEMLGVTENEVDFEILQHPSKKMFGMFGGKTAQVKAVLKTSVAQKAVNYLKEVFYYMGLPDITVDIVSESPECCELKANGDELGFIVGKHGETLDALQYLASLAANGNKKGTGFCKVRLEAGDYREKRKQVLISLGKRLAEKAKGFGKKLTLEPMKAYERKIIHTTIGDIEGVHSWSEGEGENRHIVVAPGDDTSSEE